MKKGNSTKSARSSQGGALTRTKATKSTSRNTGGMIRSSAVKYAEVISYIVKAEEDEIQLMISASGKTSS